MAPWKKALARAMDHIGGDGRKLVANWDKVEKELSEKLIGPYREELHLHLDRLGRRAYLLGRGFVERIRRVRQDRDLDAAKGLAHENRVALSGGVHDPDEERARVRPGQAL